MTRQIFVGGVPVGGDAPVTIQSMTNTRTDDVQATVAQILQLEKAGCQIIRVAVPDMAAAQAVGEIRRQIHIPLVVDIHFDYRLALTCVEGGCDAVRINPGNIGGKDRVKAVAEACKAKGLPIRIGVNSGSLEKPLLAKYGGVTPEALVESAFGHIALLEQYNFHDICISLKSSSVATTMAAYRLMSEKSDYPLHLGVTETGTIRMGTIKSAIGIGGLLALGIGDTLRVSLSAHPVEEIYAARDILKALGMVESEVVDMPLYYGVALFLLLPGRAFGGKRVKKAETAEGGPAPLERMRAQLTRTAAALRDLYDSMGRGAPISTDENPAVVFDRAAEKVCRGCALCELCWQKEYTGTFNALNDATPFLLERGRALPKDFPGYFADRCIHLPDFLTAVNGELSAFLLRRQYRRQLEETRRSARGQYAQLSELLTATAAGLGEVPASGEEAAVCRIGAALRPKEGETVCGDTVVSFRTGTGLLCLLLADGMGSGEAARKESALTCRLVEQFLEAGIEPEAALKTLNSAMALRGADTGSFTTIDLLTCRPETGEAVFYKYGAAPSYLKKGGVVRRVTGGTLPAGLRGAPALPDVTRAALEPGGFAVLVSDGVADPGRDEWLMDLLAGWEGEDPQTLAGLILVESIRREGLQDDCGIQVLYRAREGAVKKV